MTQVCVIRKWRLSYHTGPVRVYDRTGQRRGDVGGGAGGVGESEWGRVSLPLPRVLWYMLFIVVVQIDASAFIFYASAAFFYLCKKKQFGELIFSLGLIITNMYPNKSNTHSARVCVCVGGEGERVAHNTVITESRVGEKIG